MATIELDKLLVLRACKRALDDQTETNKALFDHYFAEGLTKKTFWTRSPYTEEQAKQYANNKMYEDDYMMFQSWTRQEILRLQRTTESAKDKVTLDDREVRCIDDYWDWK